MTLGTNDLGTNQLPADTSTDSEELERMSLLEHLEELRSRLLHSVAALFIGLPLALCVWLLGRCLRDDRPPVHFICEQQYLRQRYGTS